jgi:asparagine N-glycosylation enzyme membrane subunit Stt3
MASSLSEIERLLSYAGPIAAGGLLVRLWTQGLTRRYPFFAFYLLCLIAEVGVLFTFTRGTERYFWAYVTVESVLWVAQILVVLELFSHVLQQYPGIASSGRQFIWIAFAAAVVISLVFGLVQAQSRPTDSYILQQYLILARVVAFTILAFLLLILGFLFWFPVQLSRNIVLYAIGYSVYFASRAFTRLAGNLFGVENVLLLSTISLGVILSCLVFWMAYLTRRGEQVDVTVGHRWKPEESEMLVRQLDSINATLLKAGRK